MSALQKLVPSINTAIFDQVVFFDDKTITKAEHIRPDHHLKEDYSLDSLDRMELVMELEQVCGVLIDDDKVFAWRTVQDIYNTIEEIK